MDEPYDRQRALLLVAIAEHQRGLLDDAGLQAAIQGLLGALGNTHAEVRPALFEADVALEYAQDGQPRGGIDRSASLKRMRRNLREALG